MKRTKPSGKSASAVILLAALLLCACGEEAGNPAVSGSTAGSSDTEAVTEAVIRPDLPDTDWNNREFRVLGREDTTNTQFSNFEIDSDGEDGEVVNDAIFRRNTAIEDRYHVVITQTLVGEPHVTVSNSVRAGDDEFDLAFSDILSIGPLGAEGIFYNLYDVNYIDFSKPWWNPDVNAAVSVKNKLFYTSSDFSLRDKSRAYIMAFNPDLAAQYDIPDIIQTVRDGKWTIDLMTEYVRTVSGDADGNGIMDEKDRYGLTMDSYNSFGTFLLGCGARMVKNDAAGVPQLVVNNEHTINAIDRVIGLTCDTNTAIFCNDYNGRVEGSHWSVSGNVFKAGRSLFVTCFPHSLKNYSENCDFNFLVVPFPKYDDTQEKYLTMADVFVMLFGIPASSPDPDFSGFMLEALSAESTNTSLSAYYDISCKTKYSYNEESAEMLDLIFDGIIYDNAIMFRDSFNLYNLICWTLPNVKKNNFASEYAKLESNAQKALEALIESIDAIE